VSDEGNRHQAEGALYSDVAAKYAVLAKTMRNATIGFVVLGYAVCWARKNQAGEIANKTTSLWQKFRKFILGFLAISVLATIGFFTKAPIGDLANLSRWAFLLTFAGVGLRTDVRDLRKRGLPSTVCGGDRRVCHRRPDSWDDPRRQSFVRVVRIETNAYLS
jgi:uncharacterized membrane protein YadS